MGNIHGGPAANESSPQGYFDDVRRESQQLFALRKQAAADSREAWQRGDRHQAKILSDRAKEYERRAQSEQARAADAIFQRNNAARTDGMVDLHGLFVAEAIAAAERELRRAKASGASSVVFIVGRGSHSKDGVSKLQPAVQDLINRHNLRCVPNAPHPGCLLAEFVSKEERGWFAGLFRICSIM